MTKVLGLTGLALAVAGLSPGNQITKELITSGGQTRAYYLYVPKSLKPSAPLLVTLHGSGHNGLSLVEKWNGLAEKEGLIVAGPDSLNPVSWNVPADGPDMLRDLVEALKAKYDIDRRRVYLFGHSAGACFAIEVALLESRYFAATAVHAGALPSGQATLIEHAERKIPMAIWVGTKDEYFPLAAVRTTRDQLNAAGFSVQLTEMQGHNHWYYDLASSINRDAWEFLKKQSLSADPAYAHYDYRR
jgi:poly(3-hydroxybutyrate) depolymerase